MPVISVIASYFKAMMPLALLRKTDKKIFFHNRWDAAPAAPGEHQRARLPISHLVERLRRRLGRLARKPNTEEAVEKPAFCHPEQSEGSQLAENTRLFATLSTTVEVEYAFFTSLIDLCLWPVWQ